MDEDKRFSHIATDPKFRRIPKSERKVKIDKRFKSMFDGKQFKVKYTVDKRGRPVNHSTTEDLKRYYELSSDEDTSENEQSDEAAGSAEEPKGDGQEAAAEETDLPGTHKEDEVVPVEIKKKLRNLNVDYARGESKLLSESSSDDDESASEHDSDEPQHAWGELDKDAETTEEVTERLAACNLDWDRIRAVDIMMLLTSFLPAGGFIKSVTIYPSEYGQQRMREEEVRGPTELVANRIDDDDEDVAEENEDGAKYHMEKLRQYQLNRLKYYYAVIVCDCAATSQKIYAECDGLEYESSAIKMDLRFIPAGMTFEQEPKEVCDTVPQQGKYQPRFFTTTALQQAKVDLTWDETDLERVEVTNKLASGKLDAIDNEDIQNYLASSSGEESEVENDAKDGNVEAMKDSDNNSNLNSIDKYKLLLQEIEKHEHDKEEKEVQMEITWGMNLKGKTESLVKKKLNDNVEKTPFEEYLQKRKEKRKSKKEIRQQKTDVDAADSDVPSDVDMNDPYFAEEFDKPEFKAKKKAKSKEPVVEEEDNNELELLMDEDDGKKHFSLKKIQRKEEDATKKKKKRKLNEDQIAEDGFQVDVEDVRFSALFSSHHFNIDPTDPHYKKTKGMEALINEKLKRRIEKEEGGGSKNAKKHEVDAIKKDAELSVLVKSVKRKTEALRNKNRP